MTSPDALTTNIPAFTRIPAGPPEETRRRIGRELYQSKLPPTKIPEGMTAETLNKEIKNLLESGTAQTEEEAKSIVMDVDESAVEDELRFVYGLFVDGDEIDPTRIVFRTLAWRALRLFGTRSSWWVASIDPESTTDHLVLSNLQSITPETPDETLDSPVKVNVDDILTAFCLTPHEEE